MTKKLAINGELQIEGTNYAFKDLINETGEKDSGKYIKFSDGTMICSGRKQFDVNFSSNNSRYSIYNVFTFPFLFVSPPVVTMSTANDEDYKYCSVWGIRRDTKEIKQVRLFCDVLGTGKVNLHYIAIGRWK